MGVPFAEPPYPQLRAQDFGPGKQYRVEVHNGGRTIVIGDPPDPGFQKTHTMVQPGTEVDVVIHGLPGRFIEKLGGSYEIPAAVVAELIELQGGVPRGTPLRLLTCHAGEAPASGPPSAQQLASVWGGTVLGADGILRIRHSGIGIDRVDWDVHPMGGMTPNVTGPGQGVWILHHP
jgi:hypothetical protein